MNVERGEVLPGHERRVITLRNMLGEDKPSDEKWAATVSVFGTRIATLGARWHQLNWRIQRQLVEEEEPAILEERDAINVRIVELLRTKPTGEPGVRKGQIEQRRKVMTYEIAALHDFANQKKHPRGNEQLEGAAAEVFEAYYLPANRPTPEKESSKDADERARRSELRELRKEGYRAYSLSKIKDEKKRSEIERIYLAENGLSTTVLDAIRNDNKQAFQAAIERIQELLNPEQDPWDRSPIAETRHRIFPFYYEKEGGRPLLDTVFAEAKRLLAGKYLDPSQPGGVRRSYVGTFIPMGEGENLLGFVGQRDDLTMNYNPNDHANDMKRFTEELNKWIAIK